MFHLGQFGRRMGTAGRQLLLVLRQRVAGQVVPQHLFLACQQLAGVPFRNVGQVLGRGIVLRFFWQGIEQAGLSAAAVGQRRRAALHRPVDDGGQLCPVDTQRIEGTGFDQRFDRAAVHRLGIHPFAKIKQAGKGPSCLVLPHNRLCGATAAAFDGRQREMNFLHAVV